MPLGNSPNIHMEDDASKFIIVLHVFQIKNRFEMKDNL